MIIDPIILEEYRRRFQYDALDNVECALMVYLHLRKLPEDDQKDIVRILKKLGYH